MYYRDRDVCVYIYINHIINKTTSHILIVSTTDSDNSDNNSNDNMYRRLPRNLCGRPGTPSAPTGAECGRSNNNNSSK